MIELRRVNSVTVFSPAKINLFLAITGRRSDGFHDLVSVVAPVSFGDTLCICISDTQGGGAGFSLECPGEGASLSSPSLPLDGTNLVLRAAEAFRAATGWGGGARFVLDKRIPMGAGLGGGSSNAVAALRGLNELAGRPLAAEHLAEIAATLGSDCPLFLRDGPVVMRGRGECVEALPERAAARLRGRRVLLFKPDISINTAWAYRRLAARVPAGYLPAEQAESRLAAWCGDAGALAEKLLYNNMEPPAFGKFVALPVLLARLHGRFGVAAGMSGSGSACFAVLDETMPQDAVKAIADYVRDALGAEAFVAEARIL